MISGGDWAVASSGWLNDEMDLEILEATAETLAGEIIFYVNYVVSLPPHLAPWKRGQYLE